MRKLNTIILALATILIVSCGKDEVEPYLNANSAETAIPFCRLKKLKSAGTDDSFYSYDQIGNIVQVNSPKGRIQGFKYNALGKVAKYYDLAMGTDTTEIITYLYDNDSLLIKAITWHRTNSALPFTMAYLQTYQYDSQKRVINMSFSDGNQPSVITQKQLYSYPGPNQAIREILNHNFTTNSWEPYRIFEYTFDTAKIALKSFE